MKLKKIAGVVVAVGSASVSTAYAAIPAAATAALTTMQADILDLVDAIWPVTVAVTVAFILLRVFKRGANSAV